MINYGPQLPWSSQPFAPLHCPNPPKTLDDPADSYSVNSVDSVVKIFISAYSRFFLGLGISQRNMKKNSRPPPAKLVPQAAISRTLEVNIT